MDSGHYTDPERESSGSSGRSTFSASSKTSAPSASLLSPRSTTTKQRPSCRQLLFEEVITEEYQPTMEEQLEYAPVIGIDPETEPELMHLAVEGLRAALPPNWRPVQVSNENEDIFYYYNFQTGQSTWEHPRDEQFRQLVAQERARLRHRQCSGRGVVRFRDSSIERKCVQNVAEDEKTSVATMRAELRSRLETEEAELRVEMRKRIAEEEAKLQAELRSKMAAERMATLQRLEQEAEETREQQRRLLLEEIAERKNEAMAEMKQLRMEVEQLKQTKVALQQQQQQQVHQSPMQSDRTSSIQARPRCPRFRTPQRCASVDEGAVKSREQNAADEDYDDDRSSGSRGGPSMDAIGRARSFLSRHLSSGHGFAVPNPPEAEAASRKRPQPRAIRASHRVSAGSVGGANCSPDACRMEVADSEDADLTGGVTVQEASAAVALAAQLWKLQCGSLPSLAARLDNDESTCSESSEQPKAKQDRLSSVAEAAARRHSQQPQHHRAAALNNPPNPRRQRIDWRKVREKSESGEQQQQQQQSTEVKLAQHKAFLFNFTRMKGLPPSGGNPLSPQA